MDEVGEDWDEEFEDLPENPSGNTDSLPEKYADLIPDTVLAKMTLTQMDSSFMLTGSADKNDYQAVVNAFKNAGYTTMQEREIAGALLYSASGPGDDMVTVSFAEGGFSMIIMP